MKKILLGLCIVLGCGTANGLQASDIHVLNTTTKAEFQTLFCALKPDQPTVFVMPSTFFKDNNDGKIKCSYGEYLVRYILPKSIDPKDPRHHAIFNIDSQSDDIASFDCDGKADVGMSEVGINCFPVNQ